MFFSFRVSDGQLVLVVLHIQTDGVRRHGNVSGGRRPRGHFTRDSRRSVVSGVFRDAEKGQPNQPAPPVPSFANTDRDVDLREIHRR